MDELHAFLGDAAFTNILLAANILVVSRMFPWARTLSTQLAALLGVLKPSRAHTEPGA